MGTIVPTVKENEMCTKRTGLSGRVTSLFIICLLVLCVVVPTAAARNGEVYIGGFPFGTRIKTDGVLVVGVREVESKNGIFAPARDAGVREGDIITRVNGESVSSCADVTRIISSSDGEKVTLDLKRDTKTLTVSFNPVLSHDGESFKSGLFIRDGAAGIGTVTYVVPETLDFAGLGHGICDSDTGEIIPLGHGDVFNVTVFGITKGEKGSAGELRGKLGDKPTGIIKNNCETGVYGAFDSIDEKGELVAVAKKEEIKTGGCFILTTIEGDTPVKAEAKVVKILDKKGKVKNFLIEVTDKTLLEKTGGIVQGMSGSPIIQNGKLIGAVTHVLVDEPTRGYGIFIENMLIEAEKIK